MFIFQLSDVIAFTSALWSSRLAGFFGRARRRLGLVTLLMLATLALSRPAWALDFEIGEVSLAFDTTLSYGAFFRIERRDPNLIGPEGGGTNPGAVNGDDGDRNYGRGLAGHVLKGTNDLQLRFRQLGAFVRASYFVDFHNVFKDELSKDAKSGGAWDVELLDAYLSGEFGPVAVRIGWQVVNWGETLLYQNGISAANGADLAKLRIAGAELREALTPSPMLWASWSIIRGLAIEGYYTAQFKRIKLEACGTYFSTTDLFCEGGPQPLLIPIGNATLSLARGEDVTPGGWREFGLALRYLAPFLHDTELGLYFVNHHSRGPILSARTVLPLPTYMAEYPDDIQLIGISFNTDVFGFGVQGEYSHRFNNPFQMRGDLVINAAISSPLDTVVHGFKRLPVDQYSLAVSKDFGAVRLLFADNMQMLAEVAATHVYEFPASDAKDALDGPEPPNAFSMGYGVRWLADYFNVIGPISLQPQVAFSHDVYGTSPTGGNFIERRMALRASVTAAYLDTYAFDVGYAGFFGATDTGNTRHDRDFVWLTLRYFF